MARIITARYPATCADCGASLPKGSRIRYYGRGKVYGLECHDRDGSSSSDDDGAEYSERLSRERGRRVDSDGTPLAMTRYGWRRGYEATGIRCMDAPCCGCCS
jgi:hypothetical protein